MVFLEIIWPNTGVDEINTSGRTLGGCVWTAWSRGRSRARFFASLYYRSQCNWSYCCRLVCSSIICWMDWISSHWRSNVLLLVSCDGRSSCTYDCNQRSSHRSNRSYHLLQLAIHLSSCTMAMGENQGRCQQICGSCKKSCQKGWGSCQKCFFIGSFMVLISQLKKISCDF